MYHDKKKLVNKLYDILTGLEIVGEKNNIEIDKVFTPYQKYNLIISIANALPTDVHGLAKSFNTNACIEKESTHITTDFKHSEEYFNTLMKELIVLGYSLGFKRYNMIDSFFRFTDETDKTAVGITNTLTSLINLIFSSESIINNTNLSPIRDEAIEQMYNSNMSKLVSKDAITVIKDSVAILSYKGNVVTEDLKNGYVVIKNRETSEILKPTTYKEPNLEILIFKHLNNNEP
jgi:hypothetical protein